MDVDTCPVGHGTWLDIAELDILEDREYDEDELKGTLVYSSQTTADRCPHCGSTLQQFQYRLYDVALEYCPNQHGYWLDRGEEDRIGDLMEQREQDMERKLRGENEWAQTMRRLRSPSLVDKLKALFH